ncbi:hypothetical protein ABK040_003233 [Willaertia magna]
MNSPQQTTQLVKNWKPFYIASSVLMVVISAIFLVAHFASMIPWFYYKVYLYAIFDFFLMFIDVFFLAIGIVSLILCVKETSAFKYKRLVLLLLAASRIIGFSIAYPVVLFLEWTSHFAIASTLFTLAKSEIAYTSPSISVIFFVIALVSGVFISVCSVGYLIQTEPELWFYLKGEVTAVNDSSKSIPQPNRQTGQTGAFDNTTSVINNQQQKELQPPPQYVEN